MDVNEVYGLMRVIARKNQLESLSPTEFQACFNTAQRNYYDFLVGRVEQYRYDKPTPRVGLNMTDNVVSRLMPFQMSSVVTVTAGVANKPVGFNKLTAMYTPLNQRVFRIEEDRFAERIGDSIDPVNESNAFYVEQSTSWRVYPTTLSTVTVKYLTVPTNVVWAYTLDGSGRPVYSAGAGGSVIPTTGSVQPVWNNNDIDEIIGRALKILGVSIKENSLINYGQQVIAQGE